MKRFRVKLKKTAKKKRDKVSGPFPYKKALIAFSLFAILAVTAVSVYALYAESQYFMVRDVVIAGRDPYSTVNYADIERMAIGKNIFSVDPEGIRKYMLENYRELRDLHIERAFPGSIIATAVLRKPVAHLYRQRYYPIDADGVILSGAKDSPDGKLPVINGVTFDPETDLGKATGSNRARKALELLKELGASGILDGHTLVEIDASNARDMTFFLEDGLEVKIGREHYASRLGDLKEVLQDPKVKPSDIRYIDLRFKEPVIGPKWKR